VDNTSRDTKHTQVIPNPTPSPFYSFAYSNKVYHRQLPKQFSPHSLMNSFPENLKVFQSRSSRSLGNLAPSETLISNLNPKKTPTLSASKTLS